MVFQDAGASLAPWLTVQRLLDERLRSEGLSGPERRRRIHDTLGLVGLRPEVAHARPHELTVLDVFETKHSRGPNLVTPRSKLRIVPGKLGGSPHLVGTRLESQALGALALGGLATPVIYKLYPDFDLQGIEQAISLEQQLERNLHPTTA